MAHITACHWHRGGSAPAIRVIADDLNNFAECEVQSSCLSQRGAGGFGPVAAELKKLSNRTAAIAAEFENGEATRRQTLETINALTARYQTILGQTDDDIWQRRSRLQSVHAEIEQATAALSEAAPVDLLRLYAEELQQGVSIPNRSAAARRVNAILKQHGDSLSGILQSLETDIPEPPVFPRPPRCVGYVDLYRRLYQHCGHYLCGGVGFPIDALGIYLSETLLGD